MDLHRVRHRIAQGAGEDRRAHHEVVHQRDVRTCALDDLAHGGDVRLQIAVQLVLGELLERAGLDAVVAIGDVDGQQAAEVRAVDRGLCRRAPLLDAQSAGVPVARRIHPLQLERRALLAEQVQLVPGTHQRRPELGVVDVGARAVEQVPVEDEDAHDATA